MNQVPANPRIVFFGDSICVGQGVSIHRGWVPRIAARIEELDRRCGRGVVVVNASVNGNTTRQALDRMPYEVQSGGVGIMLTQFGMNDCNYWLTDRGLPRVSRRAFAANLSEIISRGIRFGAQKVLLNTNHPTTRDAERFPDTDLSYQESNLAYNELVREVAAEFGDRVLLSDIEARFLQQTEGSRAELAGYLLDDGLHLNVSGHDLYFDVVCPVVERAFAEVYG